MDRWQVPKGPSTHVFMNGGILAVPPEDTQEFHRTYIETINSGTKLYVVEQKTENFKFFVDLDYKAPEKLKDEDLLEFCSIIHKALETSGRCLIARARPRVVSGLIKSGVHIHWPDMVVTRIQALNLRTKIIQSLGEGPWDQVIYASVYGGSGLRMLWSHKKPTGDPYVPWKMLDGTEISKDPSLETLSLFSIRTFEVTNSPSFEPSDPELISKIEEYVQRYLAGQRRAHVKKVQRHEHDGWFVQTDSKFCEKIKCDHKSNHVWFSIHSGRISQRCLDEDCAEFKGTEHILPPSIVERLEDVAIVGSPSRSFFMDVFPSFGSR